MFSPFSGRASRLHPMWKYFTLKQNDRLKCNQCDVMFKKTDNVAVYQTHLIKAHRIKVEDNESHATLPSLTPRRRLRASRSVTLRPINYAESPGRDPHSLSPSPSSSASKKNSSDYCETRATSDTTQDNNCPVEISSQSTQRSYSQVKELSGAETAESEVSVRSSVPSVQFDEDLNDLSSPSLPKKRHLASNSQNSGVVLEPFESWQDNSSWIVKKAEAHGLQVCFAKNSITVSQKNGISLSFVIKDAHVVVKTHNSAGELEKKNHWPKGAGFVALILGTIDVVFSFL